MKLVVDNPKSESQNQQPLEDYQSWDPFTQTKFIYEINKQVGNPISRNDAYETATQATRLLVSQVELEACPNSILPRP